MGIHDRAYYRETSSPVWGVTGGRVCRILVLVNVGIWVLQVATANLPRSLGPVTDALCMDPEAVFHQGQVWRLITAVFLHSPLSFWHVVINMLLLWIFGPDLEDIYGPKEFLAFYLVAGVCSTLFWGLSVLAAPAPLIPDEMREMWAAMGMADRPRDRAYGASGAVMAVMVLCALHFPYRQVLIMFIFPVPLWLLVSIYVAFDVWQFATGMAVKVAVVGHLAGAGFGVIYYWFSLRIMNLVGRWPPWRWPRRRASLRLYRPDERPATREDEELRALRERLDQVLAKLTTMSREELPPEDQEILRQASEAFRQRRR
ncbi:MAG TPA: rhomboid family intramembrane serine protease [Gemmatales bacterium]|nr:rhomboid family intramembrane serine protease [Gemmatales bacterium]